jgi:hypothetical protein
VLPGSDHGAPVAHPDWVAAMLLEFLARGSRPTTENAGQGPASANS